MGNLPLAQPHPVGEVTAMPVEFAMLRRCPKGILCICSSCHRSGDEYLSLMLTHKQLASAGLIWCPQCYEGLKGRRYVNGHLGHRPGGKKGGATLPLQKPGERASSSPLLSGTACNGTIFESFPTLWEFLTLSTWPDASSRKLGTVILFVEGDRWKCCLKDPNVPRVAFVTGKDLDSLFLAANEGLESNDLDWRPDRPWGGQGKKLS